MNAAQKSTVMSSNILALNDLIINHCDLPLFLDTCYTNFFSLIANEKRVSLGLLSLQVTEDWLRGLPSYVNIPFTNYDQNKILTYFGLCEWTNDMFWLYCARVVRAIKLKHECNTWYFVLNQQLFSEK